MNHPPPHQDARKALVAQAALRYVAPNSIIGVGTGSTVNKFIEALGSIAQTVRGAVSSSNASTERLRALGIAVLDANAVDMLDIYIDGADEIDNKGYMVKGGGAALTREKIVAAQSRRFICIADDSKRVNVLGRFPLPVEIIPMACAHICRRFADMGARAELRLQSDGSPLLTDNGQHILDVHGLHIHDPLTFETAVNQWPGVITVGVFAHQKAHVCLLGTANGVQELIFN